MKFSEKLQTLRKAKKMSQEDLSVLMDVSRQSVSKWESGTSYPEMDKLLQLCKIFSCSLDELTNDEVKEINVTKEEKVTPKNLVDSFFGSIERVYRFLTTREPKELLRIGIEFFLFLFIFYLCNLPISIILYMISKSFHNLNISLFVMVGELLKIIVQVLYWIIAAIIYSHIFKIRYIDEQKVPEIKKEEVKKELELKKEKEEVKIIETKSYLSFTNLLMKIIIYFLKGILFFCSLGLVCVLVSLCILLSILVMGVFDHLIFVGFILFTIGGIALTITLLNWFFHFIFSSKVNLKRIFISLLINTIIVGLSLGISLIELTQYEFIEGLPSNMEEKKISKTLPYKENIYFENSGYYFYDGNITYEIDNTISKDQIKIIYMNNKYYKKSVYLNEGTNSYQINTMNNINAKEIINDIKDNIKEKKIYSYPLDNTEYKIVGCKETITKLQKTMKEKKEERIDIYYQDELKEVRDENDYLREQIVNLLEEKENYINRIEEYESTINNLKDLLTK